MKRINIRKMEQKIIVGSLACFIGILNIRTEYFSYAYAKTMDIAANFEETLSDDALSAEVEMNIREKEGQAVQSILLPDGHRLERASFVRNENNEILVHFHTDKKEIAYTVKYEVQNGDESKDVKEETITYTLKNLKAITDMKVSVTAPDIHFVAGENINFYKDIKVVDEDGIDVSTRTVISIVDYADYIEEKEGTFTFTYEAMHPVSKTITTFTRQVTISANAFTSNEQNNKQETEDRNSALKNLGKQPHAKFEDIHTFIGKDVDVKEGITIYDENNQEIAIDDIKKVTIETAQLDIHTIGVYPITYTVMTNNQNVDIVRYVYVHGAVTIEGIQDPMIKKIGESYDPLTNIYAYYKKATKTGIVKESVPVHADQSTLHTATPADFNVKLHAEVSYGTIKSEADVQYQVKFHGKASLSVVNNEVTVKVGATLNDIKNAVQAKATMLTATETVDLTSSINWDAFADFNTTVQGGIRKANIHVTDPDTGVHITKEITVRISQGISISGNTTVNLVEGMYFDALKAVEIKDGDGWDIPVENSMIENLDALALDAQGNTTKRGVITLTYSYTDKYGDYAAYDVQVHVHGKLQFTNNERIDLLQNSKKGYTPAIQAHYINASGAKVIVNKGGAYDQSYVSQKDIGKTIITYTTAHPISYQRASTTQAVYVHGNVTIDPAPTLSVRTEENFDPIGQSSASYMHVQDDGLIEEVPVNVTTTFKETSVSSPATLLVPLTAKVQITPNLMSDAIVNRTILVHGKPQIHVSDGNPVVRVGASKEEICRIINASADVVYADGFREKLVIDDTDLNDFDSSKENHTATISLYAMDKFGYKVSQNIEIHTTREITLHAPDNVKLVVNDPYDPYEGVSATDGDGKTVDPKDIKIDGTVDITKPGNYHITYSYEDAYGNSKQIDRSIEVVSELLFEGNERIDRIEVDEIYTPQVIQAYYLDGNGNRQDVAVNHNQSVDLNDINLHTLSYLVTHPYNQKEYKAEVPVYVHGKVKITAPIDRNVKVNVKVNPLKGASASYIKVEDDGSKKNMHVTVEASRDNPFTSAVPARVAVELQATETINGVVNRADPQKYHVIFNGLPEINSAYDALNVRLNEDKNIIKTKLNVIAKVQHGDEQNPRDLTNAIDWSEFDQLDTSQSGTQSFSLRVIDDDGAIVKKTFYITVSSAIIINLPTVNKIVNDNFNPKENVEIYDGMGNKVNLDNVNIDSSEVDMSSIGNYPVRYSYTDVLGNVLQVENIIHVHGDLVFNVEDRIDLIEEASIYTPSNMTAHYMNSDQKTISLPLKSSTIDQSKPGKYEIRYTAQHPLKSVEEEITSTVYVHGKMTMKIPDTLYHKVDEEINPIADVYASYDHVEDDGTILSKDVEVTSSKGTQLTSKIPASILIDLHAEERIVPNLTIRLDEERTIVFNSMPVISVTTTDLKVHAKATLQDIKNALQAKANVQYGDESTRTDLTNSIDWTDAEAKLSTIEENTSISFVLSVKDRDGAVAEKTIQVTSTKEIHMILPDVNIVEGDAFDPTEGVLIYDGEGNIVDFNEVIITNTVDTSKPGKYEVTYEYVDKYGNHKKEMNTIQVHGGLQFEGLERVDRIIDDASISFVPETGKAYYINAEGERVDVMGSYKERISANEVGKTIFNFEAIHPINQTSIVKEQAVYSHGKLVINTKDMVITKVGNHVDPLQNAKAYYSYVEENGAISVKNVPVDSEHTNITSDKPGYVETKLIAKTTIHGIPNEVEETLITAFNGYAYIQTEASYLQAYEGNLNASLVMQLLQAKAFMMRADGTIANLTPRISYENLSDINYDKEGNYTIVLVVEDEDGIESKKSIQIQILKRSKPVAEDTNIGNQESNEDASNNEVVEDDPDRFIIISKDIPMSKFETEDLEFLLRQYITVKDKNNLVSGFELITHNVSKDAGAYEATIRLMDGSEKTIRINIVDDRMQDVQHPEYGKDEVCITHWLLFLFMLGYSVYAITEIIRAYKKEEELEQIISQKERRVTK